MPTPILDPDRGWKLWSINEIYDGVSDARYVPNVGDLVSSQSEGFLNVVEVDPTTKLSTLSPHRLPAQTGVEGEVDLLLGVGAGRISESYRAYIDSSVTPSTMALDRRLKVYGSEVVACKVFEGTDLHSGEVISRLYDQNGALISENIPLELVETDVGTNLAIQVPTSAYTSKLLDDGTPVLVVFYDVNETVVSTSVLLVENTAWVRSLNESMKYVTSIELESSFLSAADDHLLECPINIPVDAIPLLGVVNYSNGDVVKLPIDGTKFRLYGLQQFLSTVLGQVQPISLIYYLSPDEASYGTVPGSTDHISESYSATTLQVDGAYSIKLFSYPVWIDEINGYSLSHFLYNLERDVFYDVTSLVTIAANSPSYIPTAYGTKQNLTFSLDLSAVSPLFKDYIHLQTTGITLYQPGIGITTNWLVSYETDADDYGVDLQAQATYLGSNLWDVDISNGFGSQAAWLAGTYNKILPLYDSTAEATPPIPDYFVFKAGDFTMEASISMWDSVFNFSETLAAGENVYIHFFKRTGLGDLQLGTAALSIYQTNP